MFAAGNNPITDASVAEPASLAGDGGRSAFLEWALAEANALLGLGSSRGEVRETFLLLLRDRGAERALRASHEWPRPLSEHDAAMEIRHCLMRVKEEARRRRVGPLPAAPVCDLSRLAGALRAVADLRSNYVAGLPDCNLDEVEASARILYANGRAVCRACKNPCHRLEDWIPLNCGSH